VTLPSERCGFLVLREDGVVRVCSRLVTHECLADGVLFHACDACAAVRSMRGDPASRWARSTARRSSAVRHAHRGS
jgi:hypothetical protein